MKRTSAYASGFTIVEVIIVIIVIGILSAITVVSYQAVTRDAKVQGVKNDLQAAAGVLKKYRAESGAYPAALTDASITFTSGGTFTYRRDYATGTFCLMGTVNGVTSYIEDDNRDPQDGQCPIVNVATNPSGEVSTSGVSGYNGSPVANPTASGNPSGMRIFQTTTNSSASTQGLIHTVTNRTISGITYRCSMSFKAANGTSAGRTIVMSGRGATTTGGYLSESWGAQSLTLTTSWQRISITFTTPASIGTLFIQYRLSAAASGVGIQSDALLCTEGTATYNYADGASPNWEWLGTAGLSESKGPAV